MVSEWGDEVAKEKDELLERVGSITSFPVSICTIAIVLTLLSTPFLMYFYSLLLGQTFIKEVTDAGHWADYIDPCSGLPANSDGNKIYGSRWVSSTPRILRIHNSEC